MRFLPLCYNGVTFYYGGDLRPAGSKAKELLNIVKLLKQILRWKDKATTAGLPYLFHILGIYRTYRWPAGGSNGEIRIIMDLAV